jgi:DUF4097 and DUF4098 domain-containing protein YvlB
MRVKYGLALAAFAIGALGTSGCAVRAGVPGMFGGNQVKATVQKRFKAEKVNTLRVEATAGDIKIEPASDGADEILIRATKGVTGNLSAAKLTPLLNKVQVSAALEDSALVVRSRFPQESFPSGTGAYVNYAITVPKRLALDLNSASGDIKVSGVQGGAKIHSASGDVELQEVGGALDVTTASGDTSVESARIESLKLQSASGDVKCEKIQAAGSALKVAIVNQSGDVAFSGDATDLSLETASGEIEAELTAALTLAAITIHSASGGVTLTLPRSVSAKVSVQTSSGDMHAPDGGRDKNEDEHSLHVTLGGGVAPVTIQTASGDITVRADK